MHVRRLVLGALLLAFAVAPALGADDDEETGDASEKQELPVDKRGNPGGGDIVLGGSGGEIGPALEVHKEGDYGGVTPGKARDADDKAQGKKGKKAKKPKKGAPRVTWLGFQAREGGGARVFVELTREVEVEQRVEGGKLVVYLPGAVVGLPNNARFLDTSFFDTPVARIEVKRNAKKKGMKRGVALIVSFKKGGPSQAQARFEAAGEGGGGFLYLDF